MAKPEENAYRSRQIIKIRADGSIEGEARNFGSGDIEASLRLFYIENSPTEIKETLEKRIDKIFPGAKLLQYSNSDPLNFKEKFVVNVKYYALDYCKNAGNILIFDLPGIRQSCAATGKRERRYPLVSWTNSYEKKEVEFNIPQGYDIYYLPEPVEVMNQYFEFRSTYQKEDGKIVYQGEFVEKAIRISPEEYPAYQGFCQQIGKSFRREVLFRKKERH